MRDLREFCTFQLVTPHIIKIVVYMEIMSSSPFLSLVYTVRLRDGFRWLSFYLCKCSLVLSQRLASTHQVKDTAWNMSSSVVVFGLHVYLLGEWHSSVSHYYTPSHWLTEAVLVILWQCQHSFTSHLLVVTTWDGGVWSLTFWWLSTVCIMLKKV